MANHEILRDMGSSSTPVLSEKYRCMAVWDTRLNRDVGWLMVKKKAGLEVLNQLEVEKKMSHCQWRSCNLNLLQQSEDDDNCKEVKEIEVNMVKAAKEINYEEASTSTETKEKSVSCKQQKQSRKIDCGVQVGGKPVLDYMRNLPITVALKSAKKMDTTFLENMLNINMADTNNNTPPHC